MKIWLPSIEQILIIHQRLIARTGGSPGVRDIGLIESALARATAAFGGVDAYPGLVSKAAAVAHGLTQNHGFVDGNKRIGVTAMLMILRQNGFSLQYTQAELVAFGLELAQGHLDVAQVEVWIQSHHAE